MSIQNEMRRVKKTNLEFRARTLRSSIDSLCSTIQINLDCDLHKPEDLPVAEIDAQWDEVKAKWGELVSVTEDIRRLEEELR